jgi:uncharacterized protein YbjT (DUF2867 family)
MKVGIVGGHGKIALLLGRLLTDRGDTALGIIRDPDQATELRSAGMVPLHLDVESASLTDLTQAFAGLDAVVFAAGAGPGSTKKRKDTVDRGASDLSVRAAQSAEVTRFVQISSMGAHEPPSDDGMFSHYLRAKAAAERTLTSSDLEWVILRPGQLTDEPGTDHVSVAPRVPRGAIPRADVAAVLLALLDRSSVVRTILETTSGPDTPAAALDDLDTETGFIASTP